MAGRSTSVTDRVPVVSSSYHQKCIESSVKATKEAVVQISRDRSRAHSAKTYTNCNKVAQDQLWKDVVQKELNISKEWYGVPRCFCRILYMYIVMAHPVLVTILASFPVYMLCTYCNQTPTFAQFKIVRKNLGVQLWHMHNRYKYNNILVVYNSITVLKIKHSGTITLYRWHDIITVILIQSFISMIWWPYLLRLKCMLLVFLRIDIFKLVYKNCTSPILTLEPTMAYSWIVVDNCVADSQSYIICRN